MSAEYTLWMQKTKDGSAVKNSLTDFGFAINDIPWPAEETEEVATRTWVGEHGEDIYIPPSGLKLKAYDLEIEFCYKGNINTAYSAYNALRNYLTGIDGSGGELKIYDPYWRKGRKGVRVKKFGDIDPRRSNVDEGISVKVTFRVADPITDLVASTDANGNIISLGVL